MPLLTFREAKSPIVPEIALLKEWLASKVRLEPETLPSTNALEDLMFRLPLPSISEMSLPDNRYISRDLQNRMDLLFSGTNFAMLICWNRKNKKLFLTSRRFLSRKYGGRYLWLNSLFYC